ncbi:hypothetical protein DQ384_05080 [Sphaerisporangium album]|uniref:Uncharacterized protein n=1 Tax=Sphaerisporangium album TaxID=509200 RepID=A0A367FPT8_9ACTN|nr:hypothetical protein [Sphaerisporangium album]RCG31919.1 hypothetical protein DQ384_05080 [Sphaerisporangium album]
MTFRTPRRPDPFRMLATTFTLLALCAAVQLVIWLIGGAVLRTYADLHLGLVLLVLAGVVGFAVDHWRARRRFRRGRR